MRTSRNERVGVQCNNENIAHIKMSVLRFIKREKCLCIWVAWFNEINAQCVLSSRDKHFYCACGIVPNTRSYFTRRAVNQTLRSECSMCSVHVSSALVLWWCCFVCVDWRLALHRLRGTTTKRARKSACMSWGCAAHNNAAPSTRSVSFHYWISASVSKVCGHTTHSHPPLGCHMCTARRWQKPLTPETASMRRTFRSCGVVLELKV